MGQNYSSSTGLLVQFYKTKLLTTSSPCRRFQTQYEEYCLKVTTCILDRLAWSDLPLIRDIIFILGTQGWQKIIDDGTTAVDDRVSGDEIEATPRYSLNAIDGIAEHFKVPLEDAGVFH